MALTPHPMPPSSISTPPPALSGILVFGWCHEKKGYGVARGTCVRVSEKFEAEDSNKLVELYANGSTANSTKNLCSRIYKVIRQDVLGDEVEKQLSELNVEFTGELVEMVLERIASELNKARVYMEVGNVLTNLTLDSVLKSLTSVGRFGECYKILKAMEEYGLIVSCASRCRIAFQLSSNGRMDEVREFINGIEASVSIENYQKMKATV
ncbi:hypothetical protein RJ639_038780 [Escallonia herrerae]|uniref:Uncharacterized protein n=1 Tax=Escallonia herrerae TaxID=1293975 RepID=A0AA88X0A9_9ASTE|nr:hypothetical protein RJ639_038780 [Escallonia herrerae]